MLCDHPECTGNHHRYPNLCPRSKQNERERKMDPAVREKDKLKQRERYHNLSGYQYAYLLLTHRRAKALTRIDKRRR